MSHLEDDLPSVSTLKVIGVLLFAADSFGSASAPLVNCLQENAGRFCLSLCQQFAGGEYSQNETTLCCMVSMILVVGPSIVAATQQRNERSEIMQRIAWVLASLLPDLAHLTDYFCEIVNAFCYWYFASSTQSRCLMTEVCRLKIEDICQCYLLPKNMLHLPDNTLKPRIGAIDEADETTKAHNSILVKIIQTAAAYCRFLGKHETAGFLDRCAHGATASTKTNGKVTALKD